MTAKRLKASADGGGRGDDDGDGGGFQLFSSVPTESTESSEKRKLGKTKKTECRVKSHVDMGADGGEPSTTAVDEDWENDVGFKELGVSEWLQGVCRSLGMDRPTQVQRGCIPSILLGRDVLGTAQTGSGKTAAFALPILQKLAKEPYGVFALVLTPTRELAMQLADQFRAFGAGMNLKDCVIIGGLEMNQQAKALSQRPHVVIATPGRLRALLERDEDIKGAFKKTSFLVLDEADRLLEQSFESELALVLETLPTTGRQTLLFSATMTKSLTLLADNLMKDAYRFEAYEGLRTADKLRQQYMFIPAKVKEVYLAHLLGMLEEEHVRSCIIFTSTIRTCQLLQEMLEELDIPSVSLHSGKPQRERMTALNSFKSSICSTLIATDVASRGLDIPTVDLVINFDLPMLARDYVHRVGRTARAGRSGWCLSFVTQYDVELVHKIESLIDTKLDEYELPEDEVLKGITKVYSAKRTASVKLAEEKASDKGQKKRARKT